MPVTKKARLDPAYVDYLNRAGEDNDTHYAVKLEASKILLENSEHTFVTPVFNGSASLRQAAGQLIEETCKAVRRKQSTDSAALDAIYEKVATLNHLDQIQVSAAASDLGPLSAGARALLIGLGLCWLGIISAFLLEKRKKAGKGH